MIKSIPNLTFFNAFKGLLMKQCRNFSLKNKLRLMKKFPIQQYEAGQRLDRFLKKSPVGWVASQKGLRTRDIMILKQNGQLIYDQQYRLEKGDILFMIPEIGQRFSYGKKQISSISFQRAQSILDKMLLFDNQHISILNKPSGFSVQGGLNTQMNLFTLMAAKYNRQIVHVTHRLDKCTSGLVIMAKNRTSAQIIQTAMQSRKVFHKYYIALTAGEKINKQGYIRCNIEWAHGKARLSRQNIEESKDCITFYRPIFLNNGSEEYKDFNFLGLKLLTGRKHQIRCHLGNYLSCPIINDRKYGGKMTEYDEKGSLRFIDSKQLKQMQNTEDDSIYLHALGIKVTDKQVRNALFSTKNSVINQQLGTLQAQGDSLFITGKPYENWPESIRSLNTRQVVEDLDREQKKANKIKPKIRKILSIE